METLQIPTLETARLLLRPPQESDLPAWAEFFADADVARYISKRPLTPVQRAERALRVARETWAARAVGGWVIAEKADGAFLGAINIESLDGTEELEIGYGLMPRAWGKGFATEAVRAAAGYAFETAAVPRLTARVVDANTASSGVLLKLGFDLDREEPLNERRLLIYTLTREKFAPGDAPYAIRP
jgi:RimJ/RimL family protein N-acetyltransferase